MNWGGVAGGGIEDDLDGWTRGHCLAVVGYRHERREARVADGSDLDRARDAVAGEQYVVLGQLRGTTGRS